MTAATRPWQADRRVTLVAGVVTRKNRADHSRFMILAAVALADVGPGQIATNLFPAAPATPLDVWLVYYWGTALVLVAMILWDLIKHRRVTWSLALGTALLWSGEAIVSVLFFVPAWKTAMAGLVLAWGWADRLQGIPPRAAEVWMTEHAAQGYEVVGRSTLPADTVELARFLIGHIVVRTTAAGLLSGRIVETEAYPVGDAASHAYRGQTARNQVLFGRPGHAYVYLAYGVSWMLNVSSEAAGVGAGVLIRALEPLEGVAAMQRNRGSPVGLRDIARGPGRLAAALNIDRRLDGVDLCQPGPLWIGADGPIEVEVGTSTRIGLSKEAERPLRFYARHSRFLSGPKALSP